MGVSWTDGYLGAPQADEYKKDWYMPAGFETQMIHMCWCFIWNPDDEYSSVEVLIVVVVVHKSTLHFEQKVPSMNLVGIFPTDWNFES